MKFFIICIMMMIFTGFVILPAQVPQLIHYQGVLTDEEGTAITGNRSITFSLHDTETEGSPLWDETQNVILLDGLFSVLLGSVDPIPYSVFDNPDVFLGVKVGSDDEMTPRSRLVSVGYALHAHRANILGGKTASDFVRSVDDVPPDLNGNINLIAGDNISIESDPDSSSITISATGGGSGSGITGITAGIGLDGGGTEGEVTVDVEVPLHLSSNSFEVVKGTHTSSGNYGFLANHIFGVFGFSNSSAGVSGSGINGIGVSGYSEQNYGVYGRNLENNNYGYLGGRSFAVQGIHTESGNFGYLGSLAYGAYGYNDNGNIGYLAGGAAVWGKHNNGNYGYIGSTTYGVYGEHKESGNTGYIASNGWGVYGGHGGTGNNGFLGGSTGAVVGFGNPRAGYFSGNVDITGNLSKGGGSFKIDHPLDPENKYLQHSFVESPDMKNVYDGVTVLDGSGEAVVTLPDYFEALNRDFRYQLTPVGASASDLYIAEEISGNRFRIAGGTPGLKVSWQITGIRQDAWAKENPVLVEPEKPSSERGQYMHPSAFGKPIEQSVNYREMERSQQELEDMEKELSQIE